MSSTSPTPNEESGQTPTPKPQPPMPASPEPKAAPLSGLTPPTQPDLQQEPVCTTHHILGQRLVIKYQTAQRGDREALVSAEMRLLPPVGSSYTRSAPYTIKPTPGDAKAESDLLGVLCELRDTRAPVQDSQIVRQLQMLSPRSTTIEVEDKVTGRYRERGEIPHMTLLPPSFDRLDIELELVATEYLSSRVQNGMYQECRCHISLKNNAVWAHFKAADGTPHLKQIEAIGASKDLPLNISEYRARQIAWRNLTGITDSTMKLFRAYGAHCAMSAIKNALPLGKPPSDKDMPVTLDERLRLGIVRDFALDTVVTLTSGATIVLDIGEEVAAVSISSTGKEDCSTCCFVFDSHQSNYLRQNWTAHLDQVRLLMENLVGVSPAGQGAALEKLSKQASHVFDRRCPISHIVGDQAAQSLAALDEAGCLRAWLPNTVDPGGRHELLQGYERVELTLAHFAGAQENLAAFSSAEILVAATGSTELSLKNQLGNRLKVTLSERAISKWGGVGRVTTSLAFALSTRDIAQAHTRVLQLLENMAAPDVKRTRESQVPLVNHDGFPPRNELECRTFAVAAGIVKVAHDASHCYGNHVARWMRPSHAVAVIRLAAAMYAIEFEVEAESIREVVLRGQAYFPLSGERVRCLPTLRFTLPPAATPLLMQALPEIFADSYEFGGPKGYSAQHPDALERTKIFRFLTIHAQRIVEKER